MTDLFGDSVTTPQCAESVLRKSLINSAHGFQAFWDAWPRGPRRVAKQQCLDKWARFACAENATLIVQHVEWMKTQDDWLRGFIPRPETYLNQRRWLDWEPPEERRQAPDALAVIKAHRGAPQPPEIREKLAALRRRAIDKS